MESSGNPCMTFIMFVVNILICICGGGLMGIGIWVLSAGKSLTSVVGANSIVFYGIYIIIAVGVFLILISFLGCGGTITESECMLGIYFVIILLIFIVQTAAIVVTYMYSPQVRKIVIDSIPKYNVSKIKEIEALTLGWDSMQAVFGCCGFNSSKNWLTNKAFSISNGPRVPLSCCTRDSFSLESSIINEANCLNLTSDYHEKGCEATINKYYSILEGVGIGVLVIEVLAMISSVCLYRGIEDKDETDE